MTRDQAYTEIAHVEGAALRLAEATALETQLADERSLVKDAAIRRLMASDTFKSVTKAEAFVEFDQEFLAHRVREREAVAARIVAQGKLTAAELRARLAVELCAIDEQARDPDYEIVGEHCPDCGGTGDGEHDPIEGTLPCKKCSGKGVLA